MTTPTYLYQFDTGPTSEEDAAEIGAEALLAIVEEDFWNQNRALNDDHILDEIIDRTNRPDLEAHLDELSEGMFASDLSPDSLRELFKDIGCFEETELFE